MKKFLPRIFQLILVALVAFPGAAFAADLGIQPDSVHLSSPDKQVPAASAVTVTATVENLSSESASADIVLSVDQQRVSVSSVSLDANATKEVQFIWNTPAAGSKPVLQVELQNQKPGDDQTDNDLVKLLDVQVIQTSSTESSSAPSPTQAAPAEAPAVPLDQNAIPSVTVQTEQLAWNSFRFRPSAQLGQGSEQYTWDFGDGTTSSQRVIEHTFSKPGNFAVKLTVLDGTSSQIATTQVHIGFFHLANWRLWIFIGLLALIIIVAAIIAGVTDDLVDESGAKPATKKAEKEPIPMQPSEGQEESVLNTLTDSTGELDSLAATGMGKEALEDDLSFLEDLKPAAPTIVKASSKPVAIPVIDGAKSKEPLMTEMPKKRPRKAAKKKTKKKTTIKKSKGGTRKRTTKKK